MRARVSSYRAAAVVRGAMEILDFGGYDTEYLRERSDHAPTDRSYGSYVQHTSEHENGQQKGAHKYDQVPKERETVTRMRRWGTVSDIG